jgi:glycosyltransferase involved in cell wall biosynthesis
MQDSSGSRGVAPGAGEPKRLLMIAEKFPPFNQSGSARPFYFAKYLPEFGYVPQVLASTLLAADERDPALLLELPAAVHVQRTPRLLSPLVARLRAAWRRNEQVPARSSKGAATASPQGRFTAAKWARDTVGYLGWWSHWELDWAALATLGGAWQARRERPQLIWASGPHFRNFVVASRLAAWLNLPLVIDLRDPWTYGSLWRPRTDRSAHAERAFAAHVLSRASRIVFTSPLTLEAMHQRFPCLAREQLVTITNGFDDTPVEPLRDVPAAQCLFRYIGMLNERRQPDVLIRAFARASADPEFQARAVLEFIGNAGGHERKALLAPGSNVRFLGHVARAESVRYMFGSDVNILLQTISEGQDVISGKAFDYLHARRPIVGIVDESGGDAWLLRDTGAGTIAPWHDEDAIERELRAAFARWKSGAGGLQIPDVSRYGRRAQAAQLAALFDQLV